jgi:hypothetical protein
MNESRSLHWNAFGRGVLGVIACSSVLWTGSTLRAQDAPALEQRTQSARQEAVEALKSGDVAALFAAMDKLRELAASGAVVPPGLYFAEADSARSKGDPVRAERAFNDYFGVAEPAGETYAEAMRAYNDFRFRSGLPESAWAVLEDMVPVAAGILPARAGQPETKVGAFSIARHPVSRGQFQDFVQATGHVPTPGEAPGCPVAVDAPEADRKAPMVCVSWTDARAFVAWLNANTGLELRLVRTAELQKALLRLDLRAGASDGISEWTGDCSLPPDGGGTGDRPCLERSVMPASAASDPATGAFVMDGRQEGFRSSSLGFRLALGT